MKSGVNSFVESYASYYRILNTHIRGNIIFLILLQFLVALLDGIGIAMIIPILSFSENSSYDEGQSSLIRYFSKLAGETTFTQLLIFILLVFAAKGLIKFLSGYISARYFKTLLINIRKTLLNEFSKIGYITFMEKGSGHFANLVNTQANGAISFFNLFARFNSTFGNGIIYLLLSFVLDWKSSCGVLFFGGGTLLLLRRFSSIVERISKTKVYEESTLNKFVLQIFAAFKYLKSTNRYKMPGLHAKQSVDKLGRLNFKIQILNAFTLSIYEPIIIAIIMGLIYLSVVILGNPIEPLLITLLLFYRTMNTMLNAQSAWQSCMEYSGSLKVIDEELLFTQRNQEKVNSIEFSSFNDQISFRDVSLTIGSLDVLSGINLKVHKNQFIGIVGPSGSGKSSLINMITGLYPATKGNVVIDEFSLETIELGSWRSKIGFISQEPILFDDTIYNNICLWEKDDSSLEKVEKASVAAHCHEFVRDMPDGYETIIGENGVKLSGGQKQRINIARELYKQPEILIFDEATSALDSESEWYIQDSIQQLKGRATVIIIAHRLSTVVDSDVIYVMQNGKITEHGPFNELIQSKGSWLKKMSEIQGLHANLKEGFQ